ncbi:MAG: transposase [Methanonatronarchaeia archaeon]|nr:MAG: transposase [Methanonatronarchaeia archaeon]
MVSMKRTNRFNIEWNDTEEARDLALGCSTLWNKLTHKRRQSFFDEDDEFDWSSDELYDDFKGWIGSATAQQIIRKNNSAWKSFFSLLDEWKDNKEEVDRPSPVGYWKDRDEDEKELKILVRNDCYSIEDGVVKLPFGVKGEVVGQPHWDGKQGRLEIIYDRLEDCWRAYQSVEVEPRHQPSGQKTAYVDLGVIYPVTAYIEGEETTVAYNGRPLLSKWWLYNKQIEKIQSTLKEENDKYSSERLERLFRKRKRVFKDKIRKIIHDFVERCYQAGVDTIIAGDLNGIRDNVDYNKKSNSMIHNYWSHKYLVNRLRWTVENYGMELKMIDERGTSSKCPRCGSEEKVRRGRLYKCKECGIEAHRDAVGALNIGLAEGLDVPSEVINRAMTRPEVVS